MANSEERKLILNEANDEKRKDNEKLGSLVEEDQASTEIGLRYNVAPQPLKKGKQRPSADPADPALLNNKDSGSTFQHVSPTGDVPMQEAPASANPEGEQPKQEDVLPAVVEEAKLDDKGKQQLEESKKKG